MDVLARSGDAGLVVRSLEEEYHRARRYAERCRDHFASKQLEQMQVAFVFNGRHVCL